MKQSFLLTKIIATVGPASSDTDTLKNLVKSGVRLFRINFSHGTFSQYQNIVENIRMVEKELDEFIAVVGDLSGPKIRLGKVTREGIRIEDHHQVKFVKHDITAEKGGAEVTFSTTYPEFIDVVKPGERILLDDGNVRLVCTEIQGEQESKTVVCKVETGGLLTTAKGINLPDTDLTVESLTQKDLKCIDFAIEHKFDFLALSFVRKAEDVLKLKEILKKAGAGTSGKKEIHADLGLSADPGIKEDIIPVIAKIEKPQAIANLEEIVKESDAVMVARGDLGVEMDLADVAILQKQIIRICHKFGKPVIVATQMLQSMIESKTPTRAEVSDVANAIFDGVDAVMLSGETAVGKYPVDAVKIMNQIASRTNNYLKKSGIVFEKMEKSEIRNEDPEAIALGVQSISNHINPEYLIIWTNRGVSAVYLSQRRMPMPLLAFSSVENRLRKLTLLYGVKPIFMKMPGSGSAFIKNVNDHLLQNNWSKTGDPVVVISGDPINRRGLANRIVIHHIGENGE
ncbi:MAG: pyruvate kinase [Bacteroidales bacterium]|nr:pyruvate kinase [Bacteroidales bacterium]